MSMKDTPGWEHERTHMYEVPCHTRVIGGVLCRWWGEEEPEGVAYLNTAAETLLKAKEILKESYAPPKDKP